MARSKYSSLDIVDDDGWDGNNDLCDIDYDYVISFNKILVWIV
jgi:hypothetical protein